MRIRSLLVPLIVILSSSAVARRPRQKRADGDGVNSLPHDEEKAITVPGRYIVEFAPDTTRDQAVHKLDTSPDFDVVKVFDSDGLFFGAAIEAGDDALSMLEEDRTIARAWPVTAIKLSTKIDRTTFNDIVNATSYRPHSLTGVDKLHKAGIRGKGVTIGVVDTGVDYTHPDVGLVTAQAPSLRAVPEADNKQIGGGVGPEKTVVGGKDLVGDGCWPNARCPKEPDDDFMDFDGHGTHVSGIIAGKSKWFTGVAPDANLRMYKVFSKAGWVTDDVLVEAFLTAYEDGVDIITASIGSPSGWEGTPWALVADRIVDSGVIVTIATGNDGNMGPFLIGNGASARNALAVASVEPEWIPEVALDVTLKGDGETETSRVGHSGKGAPLPPRVHDWPVVHLGSACDLPADLNLTGKVALVEEYFCAAPKKEDEILAKGGEFVLLFNPKMPDDDGLFNGDWRWLAPAVIGDEQGQAMAAALDNGFNLTVTSPKEVEITATANPLKKTPAWYTSFGSTWEMSVKPDIAAPGSYILSLGLDHNYEVMSGTSMATPYVAGVAALYISRFGGRAKHGAGFAKMLQARIKASGEYVAWADSDGIPLEDGPPASVTLVGNGIVNASKVLGSNTQLSLPSFALNDTHHFSRYQKLEITNNSPQEVTYTFEVVPAGGYEAYEWKANEPVALRQWEIVERPLEIVPYVKFPSGRQRIAPGQTKRVEFIFEIPQRVNEANIPVYSGKIIVKGNNGDVLSVPYAGVASNILRESRKNVWYRAYGYPALYSGWDMMPWDEKSSVSFDLALDRQDFPKMQASLVFGSPEVRWDIFERDWKERQWKYPPVPGKDGFVGSATAWRWANDTPGAVFDPARDDEDDITPFPMMRMAKAAPYNLWWLGRMANGSDITPGNYSMRIAALAPFGNPHTSDNWDVWKTPIFEVLPKSKQDA